jgi:hypothetical protein
MPKTKTTKTKATPTRRTTLTLPVESLAQAEKIALSRNVNLSTVISGVVSAGLRLEDAKKRRDEILQNYRTAFEGFSEDELSILDGVMLEPKRRKQS